MTPERLAELRDKCAPAGIPRCQYDEWVIEALDAYGAEKARAERAEALLRKLEWAGNMASLEYRMCPACCALRPSPEPAHRAGCELAAIIGAKVAT